MVNDALEARLRAALAELGPDYVPRTEHLRPDGSPEFVNRLLLEPSPYLLQHAHNPVSWFPWGEEAFAKARAEGKPVLLSVGYATCHWCHVMERESFEDLEIAEVINRDFVPIKVDREVRPDVDEIYMTAVHLMTRRGGWPMTVVMTPEGEPFFAGTYFPARDGDRGARRGFLSILGMLSEAYRERRDEVVAQAQELSQRVQALTQPARPSAVPGPDAVRGAALAIARNYDAEFGGWGRAPKFPQPSRLTFLLRVARRLAPSDPDRAAALREQALVTLERMAAGGMNDQLGGGFHRYSTDARWLVPHFEKMLYDNAQLALAYLEGAQAARGPERRARLRDVARRTLDYAVREMRAPGGGFTSATDADSPTPSGESEEGWFFTWTPAELRAALPGESELAAARLARFWDVTPGGNFEGRSILHLPVPLAAFAAEEGVPAGEFAASVERARAALYAVRAERPPPGLDDKVLADWNGLMIAALARGSVELRVPALAEAAEGAADFVLTRLRDEEGRLLKSARGSVASQRAFLEDHAFLIRGLQELFEATGELRWAREAFALQEAQDALFRDAESGAYYRVASDGEPLLGRDQPADDGALPSGNAVSAENLLRFAAWTADDGYRQRADALFAAFGDKLRRRGPGMTRMLAALDATFEPYREVVIVEATPGAGDGLVDVLREAHVPNRALLRVPVGEVADWAAVIPVVGDKVLLPGTHATAYVCEQGRCERPTGEAAVLGEQLGGVTGL